MSWAQSSAKRWSAVSILMLLVVYVTLPFIAGWRRVGDLWGPKIYPAEFHGILFKLGWHFAGNADIDGTPRIGFWYRKDDRPWFYGMYSANHDERITRERLRLHWRESGKSDEEIRMLLGE